jgi:hypothetical protein
LVTEDVVNYWVVNGKSMAAASNSVKGIVIMPQPGVMDLEKAYTE